MKKTLKNYLAFCEARGINPRLVRAVIRQHGRGWKGWQESAPNLARYGVDGGFDGFISCDETTEFAHRNRSLIADYADSVAEDIGGSTTKMMQGFADLGPDYSEATIGRCLYGRGCDEAVLQSMASFAAEEAAGAYVDWEFEAQETQEGQG